MSTSNFDSQMAFPQLLISYVLDKSRLHTVKRHDDSELLCLAAAVLIGTMAFLTTACNSEDDKNNGDAASPIRVSAGSGGDGYETAGSTPGGGSGAMITTKGESGGSRSTEAIAATSGNPSTGGVGGEIAGSGPDEQFPDSGIDAQVYESGVTAEAGENDAGKDANTTQCDAIPPSSQDCSQPLAPGDDRKCTITVGLAERYYYLYAPPTYNPCEPTALIIDCHGAMEAAEVQAGIVNEHWADAAKTLDYPGVGSGWRLEADTPGGGFIVVTPAGEELPGIGPIWSTTNNDPEFFLEIVAETKEIANIAEDKVYMTGISNGSIISYQTVCPNTDVFSGIAAHSAGSSCTSIAKPVPVISFDAEPDFAYATTVAASNTMVRLNGCTGDPDPNWLVIDANTTDTVCRNDPFDQNPTLVPCNTISKNSETESGIKPTVCKRWNNCNGGVAVVFCDVAPSTRHGAANASVDAHILYGNASSLNTPSVAWRFFKSFWK
ncbi:MAG: hypothetical protein JXA30_13745 [Deltaproteobacteria bacterium]|nr:hypothetical protein [Deltaproteobacteria bacterium]